MAMLNSGHPMTSQGAVRLLTRLWWDDGIDILIQWLDLSSSRRKSALKALVDIGELQFRLVKAGESFHLLHNGRNSLRPFLYYLPAVLNHPKQFLKFGLCSARTILIFVADSLQFVDS